MSGGQSMLRASRQRDNHFVPRHRRAIAGMAHSTFRMHKQCCRESSPPLQPPLAQCERFSAYRGELHHSDPKESFAAAASWLLLPTFSGFFLSGIRSSLHRACLKVHPAERSSRRAAEFCCWFLISAGVRIGPPVVIIWFFVLEHQTDGPVHCKSPPSLGPY